jgi:hypothetical protein
MNMSAYVVARLADDRHVVEAWAGYPLQFEGQRRFGWQDAMAAELKTALAAITVSPGQSLAGTYTTTDPAQCDTENRLFTNPGASTFPKGITSICFERGIGEPPEPPTPISLFTGYLHYYRYRPSGAFEWWEPAEVVARWSRVPRHLAGDGSCRPMWLALRQAAATGQIDVLGELPDAVPFGIRIVVHATPQGPRSAPVISEAFVDGAIAAFHGPPPNPGLVADALASRLCGTSPRELERLLSLRWAGNLIPRSPFNVTPTYVQVSPCDERCLAGEVTIARDSRSRAVEISGELFSLRRKA